ncbi:MAG: hypothetical protein AB7S26_08360 [Sandaracinaceae bacterium]
MAAVTGVGIRSAAAQTSRIALTLALTCLPMRAHAQDSGTPRAHDDLDADETEPLPEEVLLEEPREEDEYEEDEDEYEEDEYEEDEYEEDEEDEAAEHETDGAEDEEGDDEEEEALNRDRRGRRSHQHVHVTCVHCVAQRRESSASDWFSEGNHVRENILDVQFAAGEQWAVGASTQAVATGRLGGSLAFARRIWVGTAPIAISTGVIVNFPITNEPSDFLQLLLRGGVALAAHRLVHAEIDALVGPSMELFSDPFFGSGARVALAAGARLDLHFLLAHGENVPYIAVHGSVLGHVTLPEYMSWSLGAGIGVALGGHTSPNML